MTPSQLRERWERRRADFAQTHALIDGVAVADEVLRDLAQLAAHPERLVTLREAATESGYTPDHLSRLVRQGKLVNYGRRRAPRFRASELPRKLTRHLVGLGGHAYDAEADARSLRLRR